MPFIKKYLFHIIAVAVIIILIVVLVNRNPNIPDNSEAISVLTTQKEYWHEEAILHSNEAKLWKLKSDSLLNVAITEISNAKIARKKLKDAQNKFTKMPLDSNTSFFVQWTLLPAIH